MRLNGFQNILLGRNIILKHKRKYPWHNSKLGNFQVQSQTMPQPHPCSADWQQVNSDDQHYSQLIRVQRHRCQGTYGMRIMRREDGSEFRQPYCRFSYPLDLHGRSQIVFSEIAEGGVRASFICKKNDPRLNQYCSMHLRSWLANCDLQIVVDEEQAIRDLVKYASKAEKTSSILNSLPRRSHLSYQHYRKSTEFGSATCSYRKKHVDASNCCTLHWKSRQEQARGDA
jgi:hypothetical protein